MTCGSTLTQRCIMTTNERVILVSLDWLMDRPMRFPQLLFICPSFVKSVTSEDNNSSYFSFLLSSALVGRADDVEEYWLMISLSLSPRCWRRWTTSNYFSFREQSPWFPLIHWKQIKSYWRTLVDFIFQIDLLVWTEILIRETSTNSFVSCPSMDWLIDLDSLLW